MFEAVRIVELMTLNALNIFESTWHRNQWHIWALAEEANDPKFDEIISWHFTEEMAW